jgi:hypothetical protein
MRHKPIRVNWDELESAFDNPNQELVYYVDLVDGHVVLEGEGEENDFDEDDEQYNVNPAPAASPGSDKTRAYIDTLTVDVKLGWIERFIVDTEDLEPELRAGLNEALDSEEPAPRIIEVLRDSPEGKDRWYLYRADRLHDMIDDWLERNGVKTTDTPPWS